MNREIIFSETYDRVSKNLKICYGFISHSQTQIALYYFVLLAILILIRLIWMQPQAISGPSIRQAPQVRTWISS